MRKHRTKDPLRHRYLRDLKAEFAKYLVLFLLLTFSIGLVSGFMVADGSMLKAYNESFEKYRLEHGHFRTKTALNRAKRKAIEAAGVTLYDLPYAEDRLDAGAKIRFYADRKEINLICLMDGAMPAAAGQIALDRMFADNNGIKIGDTVTAGAKSWTVTGLVALSDYSSLFESNADAMFDSVAFGVAVLSDEEFAALPADSRENCYAWRYPAEPADDREEKALADALKETVREETALQDYVPRYTNKAITFTGDDMGGDRVMMMTLLGIILVIIAFVFGITISNTIAKEAGVIGTLRASGYTRGELLRHYTAMPFFVTLASALAGNVLGYTWMKDVCAGLYYGSYSLPTYVTVWDGEAFLYTTAAPLVIILVVTMLILWVRLRLPPIKFLRRDLKRRKQHGALPLSPRLGIFSRFRLRVIFQNRANYIMMFVGIFFANVLLLFGMGLPEMLNVYRDSVEEHMLADYQTILTVPEETAGGDGQLENLVRMMLFAAEAETENETAEKFSVWTLRTPPGSMMEEDVMLYGVAQDSRYVSPSPAPGETWISSACADKYGLEPGETFTLTEPFEDRDYTFTVDGIYPYGNAIAVFMERKTLNAVFDQEEDFFAGYFSETPITDIDGKAIGTVIDLEAMTKISRQLMVSFGSMADLVNVFALIIFVILVFLLSKIIIEKNAHAISMTKILGYTDGEIGRLYVAATSIIVVLSVIGSLPLVKLALAFLVEKMMFTRMTGWIPVVVSNATMIKIAGMAIVTYAVVAAVEMRRIRRVPMDEALKNVE